MGSRGLGDRRGVAAAHGRRGTRIFCSGAHHRESRHLIPLRRPSLRVPVAQRCSAARVRFAAPTTGAPLLLRAVVPASQSRRAAPPGIRCSAISSSCERREPDESRQNIIGDDHETNDKKDVATRNALPGRVQSAAACGRGTKWANLHHDRFPRRCPDSDLGHQCCR